MSPEKLSIIEIPLGDPRMKEFAMFPWQLYKGDPCWTPPLNGDLLGSKILGLKGLLTKEHAYHRHAEVTHFLALRGKTPIGRISAAVNHQFNDYHKTKVGSFGFFEVINDYETAAALLDKARKWVEARGMTVMRGPGEYSNATHERQGVLIEGFEFEPTFDLTHNPPYYGEFLDRYGFQKAKDYLAYIFNRKNTRLDLIKRLDRVADKNSGLKTRALNIKDLNAEIRLILQIYNESWNENWGFLPIPEAEGNAIGDSLKMIIDPGLVRFAFVNGQPAAVIGFVPDPNCALRPRWKWYGDSDLIRLVRLMRMRRHLPRTRGMFFGVKPEYRLLGIPAVLTKELLDHLWPLQYTESDGSLILEDNEAIIKVMEVFGGERYKRWRIYDLPLK